VTGDKLQLHLIEHDGYALFREFHVSQTLSRCYHTGETLDT
jgi:hypothetical protein